VTGSLNPSWQPEFRDGHSVPRDSQIFVTVKIYTLVSGRQAHTIQIVRAHARDVTMAAAGQAYGLAPVCDRYKRIFIYLTIIQLLSLSQHVGCNLTTNNNGQSVYTSFKWGWTICTARSVTRTLPTTLPLFPEQSRLCSFLNSHYTTLWRAVPRDTHDQWTSACDGWGSRQDDRLITGQVLSARSSPAICTTASAP